MVTLITASDSDRAFLRDRANYMVESEKALIVADGGEVSQGVLDELLRQAETIILPTNPVSHRSPRTNSDNGERGMKPSQWQELPPLSWMIRPPRQVSMRPRNKYGRKVNGSGVRVRRDEKVVGTGNVGSIYTRG